jgi:hypothetical protein
MMTIANLSIRAALASLALLAMLAHAGAQDAVTPWISGKAVQPTNPLSINGIGTTAGPVAIVGASQFNLTLSGVTTLTVPASALAARICIRTAEVETTEDGTTPTTAPKGTAFPSGSCTWIMGQSSLTTLKMISATGTADVEFFR